MALVLSEFNLEGQFLGFADEAIGKFKYLRLGLTSGDVQIKVSKELRTSLRFSLVPGQKIRVSGLSKPSSSTGKIKLKAYKVTLIDHFVEESIAREYFGKAKILVCQKSGCHKRGVQGLLLELEKMLYEQGLSDKVIIERTDCFKHCSTAPNYVLQIGNKHYNNLHPDAMINILQKHFS